ncbi:hypothetical protein H6770_04300 [Candidatus Peribacteria bacterium]|nr:hypothetical protein [Candidatus Peribacteria bacterium]
MTHSQIKERWARNESTQEWYDLLRLNLDADYFKNRTGVYAIWYTSPNAAPVIKIGKGDIGRKLKDDVSNPSIKDFSSRGTLKVSWVTLPVDKIDGVEAHLMKEYSPILSSNTSAEPISINSITK